MTNSLPIADTTVAIRQSLAHGPLGTALLDIEHARRGAGDWSAVHRKLTEIGPLIDGDEANLYLGAPAMAYVLHLAAVGTHRYAGALHTLDGIVAAHTRRRLDAAHARLDAGRHTAFAEYDVFQGLTGIGALLLRRRPGSQEMNGVLEYMVRLTEPVSGPAGEPLPGWWVDHSPAHLGAPTPAGHANNGMAHGISGPLALLAAAKIRGVTAPGHDDAMRRICRWLDRIRQSDHQGTRWPQWITGTATVPLNPGVPSWCYGTPGLARAQQLAAIALDDPERKRVAERALLACLSDPRQLDQLANRGLCHGVGGLLRVVQRVAEQADRPDAFTRFLPDLTRRFLRTPPPDKPDFLTGTAGADLAFQSATAGTQPDADWDACLLLT